MGNVLHRGKGSFTHVENTIFFDHGLSAKAKGIYCQIRSLEGNPEWVFTIKGFASLVRDGADAVTAGIKELEGAGYIIRARKRSENGRFLKAEEATWITLDDPAMHGEVCAELKAEGFAILSEFERSGAPAAADGPEGSAMPPETRETGESPQVGARTGKPVSGKATSGKPAPINYSSDQSTHADKQLISCDPAPAVRSEEKGSGDFREYRKGEFPEAFERLCSLSLKPLTSLAFKRDALKAWKAKVAAGFDPEQIVVGSGAEYLYGLVVQLLGRGERCALEDPSYEKIRLVYEANGAHCEKLPLGADGIESAALDACTARVLHVTPFHSYPSGVTATAAKRREYARWARERDAYIIEDDYDAEFSALLKPVETVFSLAPERVIYMNTFTKTIAPAMRMGYMVLPGGLLARFEEQLGFYSCTVPVFEQYVLAEFIRSGELERYINRRRRALRARLKP